MLRLFDSVAGEVRELELRDPGKVSMYVCGPTVSGLPHLGHGRFALVWDVTRRWLTWSGLDVTYVSNITDIEDKIIARAREEQRSEVAVCEEFEGEWWKAIDALGIARPDHVPHATHYVPQMVRLIEELLSSDIAYRTSDGVYFDVSRVPDYGCLAGQPLDSLRAGARVEGHDEKRSPLDFALWKAAKSDEPSWPASFGSGRPGWHTECVVMSLDLLGDGFDLHAGGLDLKVPHHENERAQAVAVGDKFARHWAHNGWVMVGSEKMSKSLNNFTSLTDLLAETDQRAYRLLVLRSHYRSPIDVTKATISDAERSLERLDTFARRFSLPPLGGPRFERAADHEFSSDNAALVTLVSERLDDDLDTPGALALLFDAVSQANALSDQGRNEEAQALAVTVTALFGAVGLTLRSRAEDIDEATRALVRARNEARRAKNWAEADRLRDELVTAGWIVEDATGETVIRR